MQPRYVRSQWRKGAGALHEGASPGSHVDHRGPCGRVGSRRRRSPTDLAAWGHEVHDPTVHRPQSEAVRVSRQRVGLVGVELTFRHRREELEVAHEVAVDVTPDEGTEDILEAQVRVAEDRSSSARQSRTRSDVGGRARRRTA